MDEERTKNGAPITERVETIQCQYRGHKVAFDPYATKNQGVDPYGKRCEMVATVLTVREGRGDTLILRCICAKHEPRKLSGARYKMVDDPRVRVELLPVHLLQQYQRWCAGYLATSQTALLAAERHLARCRDAVLGAAQELERVNQLFVERGPQEEKGE